MSEQTIISGLQNKTNFDALVGKKFIDLHYYSIKEYESGAYKGSKCIYVILSSLYDMEGKFIDTTEFTQSGPRKLYLFKFFVGKISAFGKNVIPSFTMTSLDQEGDSYLCDANPGIMIEVNELNFVPIYPMFAGIANNSQGNSFKDFFTQYFTTALGIDDVQGIKIKVGDKYYDAKNLVDGFKIFFLFCIICNLFNSIIDIRNAYDYMFKRNVVVSNTNTTKTVKREDIFKDEDTNANIGVLTQVNEVLNEAEESNPTIEDDKESENGSNGSSLMSVSTVSSTSTAGSGMRSQPNQFLSEQDLLKLIKKGYEGINKIAENTNNILKDIEDSFKSNNVIYQSGVIFESNDKPIMKNISGITVETKKKYASLYNSKSMRGTAVKLEPKIIAESLIQAPDKPEQAPEKLSWSDQMENQ